MMTGVNIIHVPYRSQAHAATDLMAGRLQVSFNVMLTTIGYVRAGKLCALAVTTATRSPALPNVPTVAASVAGYEASSWHGLGAPRNILSKMFTTILKATIKTGSVSGTPTLTHLSLAN